MNMRVALYGELSKVEEQEDGTLRVFGIASSGARDDAGEIITPEAMKAAIPGYLMYPAIREMHQPSAAGTALEMSVDDETGKTHIVAHVVDPVAIAKVKSKTYRGFSVGGKVLKRDKDDPTIITAIKLAETSLVDRPCNPEASINMWKATDVDHSQPLEPPMSVRQPTADEIKARAEDMAKAAGKPGRRNDYVVAAREALIAKYAIEADEAAKSATVPDELDEAGHKKGEKTVNEAPGVNGPEQTETGDEDLPPNTGEAEPEMDKAADAAKILADAIAKAKAAKEKPYGDVKYADPKNGKYPIDTAAHIRAAWSYINMPKNQKAYSADELAAIKAKIVAAWKDKIDADGPPSAEKMVAYGDLSKAGQALALIAKAVPATTLDLSKGLYTVARVAHKLEGMGYIAQSIFAEEKMEGDTDSKLPQMAMDIVASLHALLVEMADEEVSELMADLKTGAPDLDVNFMPPQEGGEDVIALATRIFDLSKADDAALAKAGKRNSMKDQAIIQASHDHMCALGAVCDKDNCQDTEKAALIEEVESLRKLAAEGAPLITDLVAKQIATDETLTKALAEIELLKATPMPPKAAAASVVVDKAEDAQGPAVEKTAPDASDIQKWLDSLSPADRAHEIMKMSLSRPLAIQR